jgi:alkyl hydroperoxide reductase subunit AhpC
MKRFDSLDTQVLGISVDSIPCHQAWQKSLGGITFPLLSDFWPHGKTCREYGVMTDSGFSERVIFIIDKSGIIRFIDNIGLNNLPDNEKSFRQLEEIHFVK